MIRNKSILNTIAKASITVEACVVVPVVLAVVFSLLSLCFYVHNRAWYAAAAGEAAVTAGTEAVIRNADVERCIDKKLSELNGLCSFPDWCDGIKGTYDKDSVISIAAKSEAPYFMIRGNFAMDINKSMKVIRPVIFIRTIQAVEMIMEDR